MPQTGPDHSLQRSYLIQQDEAKAHIPSVSRAHKGFVYRLWFTCMLTIRVFSTQRENAQSKLQKLLRPGAGSSLNVFTARKTSNQFNPAAPTAAYSQGLFTSPVYSPLFLPLSFALHFPKPPPCLSLHMSRGSRCLSAKAQVTQWTPAGQGQ